MPGAFESEAALARFVADQIERSRVGTVARQGQEATAALPKPPVAGRVAAAGTILAGSGFTVTHTAGTGIYTITFAALTPTSLVAIPAANNLRLVSTLNYTANSVDVRIATTALAAVDETFGFIAY